MIKVLFLINTLGGGGAERVLVNLVNHMDASVFNITVETMFDGGINADLLQDHIRYINKNAPCPHGVAYLFRLFSGKQLYRYFIGDQKYDLLVAFMHGAPVKVISGCQDPKVKKIAWLHNGNPETGTFFKFWRNRRDAISAYADCDQIAGVSDSVAKAFSDYTGIQKIATVYNTNDVSRIQRLALESKPWKKNPNARSIVSVGRLSSEKGYLRLFSVCLRLVTEGYKIEVMIVGDGEDADKLKKAIKNAQAEAWFHLAGFQKNPYMFLSDAELFVCPSYQEGLSTAVVEALILGVPVVSTDVSGAREILGDHNEYGIVTENSEDGLYLGIKRFLDDPSVLTYYRAQAVKRAGFFDTQETVRQAETLFQSVLQKNA